MIGFVLKNTLLSGGWDLYLKWYVLLLVPSALVYHSDCSSALRSRSETVSCVPLGRGTSFGVLASYCTVVEQDHIGSCVSGWERVGGRGVEEYGWGNAVGKRLVGGGQRWRRPICGSPQGLRKVLSSTGFREMITKEWRSRLRKEMSRL